MQNSNYKIQTVFYDELIRSQVCGAPRVEGQIMTREGGRFEHKQDSSRRETFPGTAIRGPC